MKLLKGDNFLKILSLVIAIGLWFYVVQVHDPDMEETFRNIPVVFSQKAALESKDLILLNDKDITIDVEIRGNRKNIMNLSSSDITVVADVSSIEDKGTHTVVTTVILPYGNLETINKKPSTLKVEVDTLVTETFDITPTHVGTPKEGYAVGDIETTPEKILVTGAQTILGGIDSVVAEIDVTDKSSDITAKSTPKIFDSNGKEINTSLIKFGVKNVAVRCEILKTKFIQIKPNVPDSLIANGFVYKLDKDSLPSVNIKGPANIIKTLSYAETLPVTIADIDNTDNAEVKLKLPDGVTSIDGDTFTIKFTKQSIINTNLD